MSPRAQRWTAHEQEEPASHRILGRLLDLRQQRERLDDEIDDTALKAREAGASWAEVGEAMGISASAAYQRWSEEGKAKHAERQRRRYSNAPVGLAPLLRPVPDHELDGLRVFIEPIFTQVGNAMSIGSQVQYFVYDGAGTERHLGSMRFRNSDLVTRFRQRADDAGHIVTVMNSQIFDIRLNEDFDALTDFELDVRDEIWRVSNEVRPPQSCLILDFKAVGMAD